MRDEGLCRDEGSTHRALESAACLHEAGLVPLNRVIHTARLPGSRVAGVLVHSRRGNEPPGGGCVTAIALPMDVIDVTTSAAVEEKKKLRKHFARFDILFFLICTLVGLDTIGSVAAKGPEGFTWLAILALVFFVPYALLTSELGTAFPEEGGPYVWTRLAFGRK